MNITWWATIIWQQYGAALDMLDNALRTCPEDVWRDRIWEDVDDAPEYNEFWFIVYHALVWTDRYLQGAPEGFAPPAPFVRGRLPEQPYTKEQLQGYLALCREKAQTAFETLTDERASQICRLPWEGGEELSFAEMQLYAMRHLQEHAAQLSLHLGHKVGAAPDWVVRAESRTA